MKRILWTLCSSLMVISLAIAGCSPANTPPVASSPVNPPAIATTPATTNAPKAATPAQQEPQQAVVNPSTVIPKYGGRVTIALSTDIIAFDEVIGIFFNGTTFKLTNEELWTGDWAKGPAGTGEAAWVALTDRWDQKAGQIAESWDISTPGTAVWHMRKGVHWALDTSSEASRLVGGREVTADDVVFSLKQQITDTRAYIYKNSPALRTVEITSPDKDTVVIKYPPEQISDALRQFAECTRVVPPEVVRRYGDMSLWRVSVGTGPYILKDVIPGGSATLVKNGNYWGTDPVGPGQGNKLPYMDSVSFLTIPDVSTRLAALRTGKLDVGGVSQDDRSVFMKQRPEVLYSVSYDGGNPRPTYMRTDKAPFNDVRVRRALMMAIDFKSIVNNLYGGNAQINTFPTVLVSEYREGYLPLEEAPASVQELYSYNPDKAKQLMTEAGYPSGFKTTILVQNSQTVIDYYSILKDMWAKIGVGVSLDIKETAAWTSALATYQEMAYGSLPTISTIYGLNTISGPWTATRNLSNVNDERVNRAAIEMGKLLQQGKQKEALGLNKELMKYALDQAWAIPAPTPPSYTFWWPWLKNYHGEGSVGYHNANNWVTWTWIDQDLKKSMRY